MAAPRAAAPPPPQAAWSEQAPYGPPGAYSPYGQQPADMYYNQPPQQYSQPPPVLEPPAAPLPLYRRPGVVFGAAAVAAAIALGALLAMWVSDDGVSTTPANTTGTPSQQAPVLLVPAPASPPPPGQSVVVQPAPTYVPRQQVPAPRVAPANPPANNPAPVGPSSRVSQAPDPNQNPAAQNPQDQNPAAQNPAGQNPAGQNPAGQNPAGQNPAGQVPAKSSNDTLCSPKPAALLGEDRI